MNKNMGSLDRILRTLAALVIGILLLTGTLQGTLAVVLGILAVVFLGTSAMGYCPAYPLLKMNTLGKKG